jgi:hypothetical protein
MRDADTEIRRELMPGESVRWIGQARRGVLFRPIDLLMIPFSIVWCGFAVFAAIGLSSTGAPLPARLFCLLFVLVGVYFVIGRFFVDAWMRANSCYGITSDRIIIVNGIFRRQTKSLDLRTLSDVTLSESSNGGGMITFGPSMPWFAWAHGMAWPGTTQSLAPCFELATEAREVYVKINEARAATR